MGIVTSSLETNVGILETLVDIKTLFSVSGGNQAPYTSTEMGSRQIAACPPTANVLCVLTFIYILTRPLVRHQ